MSKNLSSICIAGAALLLGASGLSACERTDVRDGEHADRRDAPHDSAAVEHRAEHAAAQVSANVTALAEGVKKGVKEGVATGKRDAGDDKTVTRRTEEDGATTTTTTVQHQNP